MVNKLNDFKLNVDCYEREGGHPWGLNLWSHAHMDYSSRIGYSWGKMLQRVPTFCGLKTRVTTV
jgi:hypothetical protein